MIKKRVYIFTLVLSLMIFISGCKPEEDTNNSNEYVITFDSNGGSTVTSQTINEGSKVVKPSDPTKSNYTFVEWQLDSETYNFDTVVTKDFTLKANWKEETLEEVIKYYTVSFETSGGSSVNSQTVESTKLVSAVDTTKEGYTLFGWQIKGTENYFNFQTDYLTSNITLVAIWELIPSIDVDVLDIFFSEVYESSSTSTDRYIEIYNPKNTDVVLEGYTIRFAYNNATLDASKRIIDLSSYTIKAKSCLVLYDDDSSDSLINSIVISNKYEHEYILHDADDRYGLYKNDMLIDTVEQTDTITSAKDSVMIRNYECSAELDFSFDDWTVTRTNIDGALDDAGVHKFLELYLDSVIYTVTFDTDGGSTVNSKRILKDDFITTPITSRTGYDFVGWLLGTTPFDADKNAITSNITLKALWEKAEIDDSLLDVFFSEIYDSDSDSSAGYIEIFNPTENDISLDNYVIKFSYNSNTIKDDYNTELTGYTIAPYSTIVIYSSNMSTSNVEKLKGVTIKSDNIKHDGNDNYALFKDGVMIDMLGDLTTDVYSQNVSLRRNEEMYGSINFNINEWTAYTASNLANMDNAGSHYFRDMPTYTISFDSAGGSEISSLTLTSGDLLLEPTSPIKSGYKFVSWQVNGNNFDFSTKIKSDYTLTATWEVFSGQMYVVTFDTAGGSIISNQNVYEGDKVIRPINPYLYDYNLVGWSLNDLPFDFDTYEITSNITIKAVWEKKIYYTITFETEGTEVSSQTIESDQYVQEPVTTRFGYDFVNWVNEDEEVFNFSNLISSDITLYATWEALTYNPSTYEVSSVSEYNNQIKSLLPGDTLIFKDGTYDASSMSGISDSINGTDFAPITIKAQTVGGVIFTTKSTQEIKGNYITFSGFKFTNGTVNSATGVYVIYAEGVRITNVTIDAFDSSGVDAAISKSSYITIKDMAKYTEIDNCSFLNKNSPGVLLLVDKYSDDPSYAHIHHNYFYNYTNPDPVAWTNELETIRIGWSGHSQTASYTVVEYNIFEQISSETELVSIKSCNNVVRNNYILNCTAAITIRHGNTCLVENNVIIYEDSFDDVNGVRGNGIRVFDKNHVVRNNYISGVTGTTNSSFVGGIVLHDGGNAIGTDNSSLSSQWTTWNVLVQNNTLVNNDVNIALGDKNYSVAAGYITFDSNFVYSETTSALRYFTEAKVSNTNTYINEQYYATEFGYPIDTPSSVSLFVDLIPTTTIVDGLMYLSESTAGASNLTVLTNDSVGPKEDITNSSNMSKNDYLEYFNEWPIEIK